MTVVGNIYQYVLPVLVVSIAVVLFCFYIHAKKKRATYDVSAPNQEDNVSSVLCTISLSEAQAGLNRCYDRLPPRYSTVEHPPPYSLFDPKLTSVWPGGPPPAYEMYPITLPLAPHYWMTPTTQLTTESSPINHNQQPPTQRSHQITSS